MNGDTNPNEMNEQVNPATPSAESGEPAVGFCRVCGKRLSEGEVHRSNDVIYCADHVPAPAPPADSEWSRPAPPPESDWAAAPPQTAGESVSPGLAFLLGLIPGVGAIYNGQYAKGLVHVVIFGLIISILSAGGAGVTGLFVPLLIGWIFYMPFEAYHTAKKRSLGEQVDEFSSLIPLKGGAGSKAGPIILIAGGAFFLLVNLDFIELYQVVKFWPVLLIALGAWLLYSRRSANTGEME